jgi:hypothetical protein
MNCRRVRRLLSGCHDGLPIGREADAVATHLHGCPACLQFRDALIAFRGGLHELEDWQPDPLPSLRARAMDRWETAREAPAATSHRGFLSLLARPAARQALLGAAALAAFGAVLGLIGWHKDRENAIPRHQIVRSVPPVHRLPSPRPVRQPIAKSSTRRIAEEGLTPQGTWHGKAPRARSLGTWRNQSQPPTPPLWNVTPGHFADANRDPEAMISEELPGRQEEQSEIEDRVRRAVRVQDDFVRIPFPRIAATSDRQIAEAVESYKREAAIIDARLSREVTLQQKATALSDLCERLRAGTGIQLAAGASVADEKVTIFCEKMPLREVMRQLSRPFGYAWLRSKREGGEYHYELAQDLKSQLLEEELRNRDRHASLLALAKEMERYRPYLGLSPEEALARSKSAAVGEKKLLEQFAVSGWGAIQMYFRLSSQQLAALRAGQKLTFSPEPQPGELPLPPDLERGILQSQPYRRMLRREDGEFELQGPNNDSPNFLPLTAFPEVHGAVQVQMPEHELGQYAFEGSPGSFGPRFQNWGPGGPWAVGQSPSFLEPDNAGVNARLARDPALRPRVSVQPVAHNPDLPVGDDAAHKTSPAPGRKVTSADVLEALHQVSGIPIVADYYTRLYDPAAVTLRNRPLFEVLNQLGDAMHLRWKEEASASEASTQGAESRSARPVPGGPRGGRTWLQFRSASFYYDRLKEVPNRLLARWVASRREHGSLTLEDLIEIAQLSDTQLDAADMAEGAREYWGLAEWDLVRTAGSVFMRQHLRALAAFTPPQRQEMLTPAGLPFVRMSLPQQQQFLASALEYDGTPLQTLDDLAGATLRVSYTQPGWYEWRPPGPFWLRYVVALERGKRVPLPPVRGRTREAVLQAVRGIDPQIREAILQAFHRADPHAETPSLDEAPQIVPTELELTILYIPDSTNKRCIRSVWGDGSNWIFSTW